MVEYVKVRTESGEYVPFELDEEFDGPVRAGRRWDAVSGAVDDTLEAGVERAREVAGAVARKIGGMSAPRPDKVGVEIGLKVSASGAFVVAKSAVEAHVKITVEWRRDSLPAPPPEDGPDRRDTGVDPADGA
ncbi:CU044_2847 family protein [Saccharothrix australiensis]|uniref:Trypsin-co-occurring domain-containing protein n=1 Tax=Saccharothrix australiensis TaxID=2072 RepID=A0A495W884_9PSEU|nr:CU044_2847 family protein [Saccharothrix australiensis]RKT57494.1 hypothetical protein C8E97_6216 [Saccharothrix australiensis]